MTRKRGVRVPGAMATAVFLLAIAVLAPASAQQQPQPRRSGALRIAHIGEPPTLDWHWSSGAIVSHILNNLYESPVAMDEKFSRNPCWPRMST